MACVDRRRFGLVFSKLVDDKLVDDTSRWADVLLLMARTPSEISCLLAHARLQDVEMGLCNRRSIVSKGMCCWVWLRDEQLLSNFVWRGGKRGCWHDGSILTDYFHNKGCK